MSDNDQLVQRTVDTITAIGRRAARFSIKLLVVAVVVIVGSFLLGIAALSDGIRSVWIVLGVVFGAIALVGGFLAGWRVAAIGRNVDELRDEVQAVVADRRGGGRTVIETFQGDGDPTGGSAVVVSRQMYGLRGSIGGDLSDTTHLAAAVRALTTFPFKMLATILIMLVFAFLGFIFLIALAL